MSGKHMCVCTVSRSYTGRTQFCDWCQLESFFYFFFFFSTDPSDYFIKFVLLYTMCFKNMYVSS